MTALEISQLTVNYDQMTALWDITLSIPTGKLVGIVGPNGAGKSTLIKAALGLVQPLTGTITLLDQPIDKVKQKVAYVPQRGTVDWDFPITVLDLVLMGRYGKLGLFRRPRQADREAAHYYLEKVGMIHLAHRQISQLSGGQQQRAFIARALLQEADIYFLDEPFQGIDLATETLLVGILKGLVEKGKTVFVVHHDLNTVESVFDWMILLNLRLIGYGPVRDVFNANLLNQAYGKSFALLDEAMRLSQRKTG
jgi:manganese/zinc/iron transport system ATP- binding protein